MILETLTNAILDVWPMLVIFLVVLITIRVGYLKINYEKLVFYREFINLMFVIYILLLYQLLTTTELNKMSGLNIVPFTEIFRYEIGSPSFIYNVIGNILIFIPFGYFVSMYMKATKFSHILAVSLITSLTVELVQLHIGRSFDIDDIILNVSGSILGFLLFIGLTAIKKHLPRIFQSDLFYNIICLLILVVVIIYFTKIIGLGWF